MSRKNGRSRLTLEVALAQAMQFGSGLGADWGEMLVVGDGDYAVSGHGCRDTGDVCDSVLTVEASHFVVVLGAHDAGGLKTEDTCRGVVAVLVEMRSSARDMENNAFGD